MNKQKNNISLEQALDQYFSQPVPGKEFLANLEQSLQAGPKVTAQSSPKIHHHKTFRPAYAFLTVGFILIISLLVVGPANAFAALQGLIRYIPGFGLVDEKTTLRVLAEPVSITRDGVTVRVKQMVVSPERTSVSFTMQGLPPAAQPSWTVADKGKICTPIPELRLPDGTRSQEIGSGSGYAGGHYQHNYFFPPLPANVTHATLVISCLPDTLIGKAPENWEIPLGFVPAPPEFTLLPVDVIPPSSENTQTAINPLTTPGEPATPLVENTPSGESPLSLDKVVETEDGYIFIGRFRQTLPAPVTGITPQILDANGLFQGYTSPSDIMTSGNIDQSFEWAYQIREKDLAWPITIRFDDAQVYCSDPQAKLSFDAGPDPQKGQVWEINRDFSIGPCKLHVDTIKRVDHGYLFRVTHDNLSQFMPEIVGTTPKEVNIHDYPNYKEVRILYDQEPPKGLLTVSLSADVILPGPWQVQWQPNK